MTTPINDLIIVEVDNNKYAVPRTVDLGTLIQVLQEFRPVYYHWGDTDETRYHYIDQARVPDIGIKQVTIFDVTRHKEDQKREEEERNS